MYKRIEIGEIFGRLKVIEFLYKKNGYKYWKCLCFCGKETVGWSSQLRAGRKSSCGCLRTEKSKKSIQVIAGRKLEYGFAARNKMYDGYKRDAKKRNIVFEMDFEVFCKLTQLNCHYCGSEPDSFFGDKKRHNGLYKNNGIDRIDSFLGYTLDNIVPCCKKCNYMKNTLTLKEFYEHVNKIVKHGVKNEKTSNG